MRIHPETTNAVATYPDGVVRYNITGRRCYALVSPDDVYGHDTLSRVLDGHYSQGADIRLYSGTTVVATKLHNRTGK